VPSNFQILESTRHASYRAPRFWSSEQPPPAVSSHSTASNPMSLDGNVIKKATLGLLCAIALLQVSGQPCKRKQAAPRPDHCHVSIVFEDPALSSTALTRPLLPRAGAWFP